MNNKKEFIALNIELLFLLFLLGFYGVILVVIFYSIYILNYKTNKKLADNGEEYSNITIKPFLSMIISLVIVFVFFYLNKDINLEIYLFGKPNGSYVNDSCIYVIATSNITFGYILSQINRYYINLDSSKYNRAVINTNKFFQYVSKRKNAEICNFVMQIFVMLLIFLKIIW